MSDQSFQLLTQLDESINDKGLFKAVFITGGPGAGKSYTVSQITSGAIQPRIINSDRFYEYLGKKGQVDISNPAEWHNVRDTVMTTTQAQLNLYLNGMLPLFIDSTSANTGNLVRRQGILESLGYDVGMVWIDCDVEEAVKRAAARDRAVPEKFIREVHQRSEEAREFLMGRFKWSVSINNSEGMLTDAVITAAYRKVSGFFNEPVKNHIGVETIRKLKESGEKFMTPSIHSKEEINHFTTAWYKR